MFVLALLVKSDLYPPKYYFEIVELVLSYRVIALTLVASQMHVCPVKSPTADWTGTLAIPCSYSSTFLVHTEDVSGSLPLNDR